MGEVVYFANYMSVSYLFKKTETETVLVMTILNFVSTTKSSVPILNTDRLWYRNAFPVVVASLYLPKARKLGNEQESFAGRWRKERSDIHSKRTRFEASRALNSTEF